MSDLRTSYPFSESTSTPESEAVGSLIRAARRSVGLTMGDVVNHLGCEVGVVSDLEYGYVAASPEQILKIAQLLQPA